jgi:outer membrane protein TolC
MSQARLVRNLCWLTAGIVSLSGAISFAQQTTDPPPELLLSQAIEIALNGNDSVKNAKLDVSKSEWQVSEAKTRRLPETSIELFAAADLNSPSFTYKKGVFGYVDNQPVPTTNVSINLSNGMTGYAVASVMQPLTQLYKINLAIRMQQLSVDFSKEQFKGKQQSVVADVKQAYYTILQAESALEAEKALVAQYLETDRVATQYLEQESVLLSDSLEVKAKLAQAQHQLVVLKNNLVIDKEHLNNLLGRDIDTPFRTQSTPPASAEEMDLKVARQTALRQRPEVKEAEIDVSRAGLDLRLAKAQYIPDIGGAIRYFDPINTQILPQNIVSGGLALTWEPVDWGRRKDKIKQKGLTVEQSKNQLQDTRSKVLLDVDNTFRKLEESRSMIAVAQAARDASNEKLREVSNQFKQSAVLLRDVLQQQAAVANANHDYEESLLALLNATAEFEKALGEE